METYTVDETLKIIDDALCHRFEFKVENGNTAVFDASVVKLVQKISFVDKDFEYALTAQ